MTSSDRRKLLYRGAVCAIGLASAWLVFLSRGWGLSPFHFTLDDAYITFRYAEHLAEGLGPVWNPGRDPVEGYTSFAWTLLNAGFISLGLSPALASKAFSMGCVAVLMGGLARRTADGPNSHRLVAVAALGLSPAFLLIAVQGMETGLAALLAATVAWAFSRSVRDPSTGTFALFFGAGFLSILTRPDTAPFAVVLSAVLAVRYLRERPKSLVSTAVGCALVPGVAYFLWRWSFYGHLLPNSAYIKSGDPGLVQSAAMANVRTFVLFVCGPYLLAIVGAVAASGDDLSSTERFVLPSVGAAVAAGLAAGLFFSPLQGFLWRFQMPYYPVVLLLFVWTLDGVSWSELGRKARIATGVLTAALIAFPLWTYFETDANIRQRWQYDRVRAGMALADVPGDAGPAFVTDSGAIPYFSGWRTVDLVGLTSEVIAHEGLSEAFLRSLDPSLVVVIENLENPRGADHRNRDVLCKFLASEGYELRSAIVKTNPRQVHTDSSLSAHLYFVDPESARSAEITAALRGMEAVRRAPPEKLGRALRACHLDQIPVRLADDPSAS